jgi:hypothetical protein
MIEYRLGMELGMGRVVRVGMGMVVRVGMRVKEIIK